ncbi:MAG: SCO family protein [Nitrospiraceae bacterium]
MINTPIARSTFLYWWALLPSAIGLRTAEAHSTRSREGAVRDAKTSEKAEGVSRRSHIKQRAYRRTGKVSDRFPNILLRTQDNKPVRFYDDLVKDETVIIDFMYTTCDDDCPLKTANLMKVHKLLGTRVGHDILMLSISLDSRRDTPKMLRRYAERYGGLKPGWLYLTGDYDEIDVLRRKLGVYDLDPIIDADKASHAGIVTFGNDRTNRWAALPALMDSREMARTILWITRGKSRTR